MPSNFAPNVLKPKTQKLEHGSIEWIPETSKISERLFSQAKPNLRDLRHRFKPMHLESELFQYVSIPYCDEKMMSEHMKFLIYKRLKLFELGQKFIFCPAVIAIIYGNLYFKSLIYFSMFQNEKVFLRSPWNQRSSCLNLFKISFSSSFI